MRSANLFSSFVVALLAGTSVFGQQAQESVQTQEKVFSGYQSAHLKLVKSPVVPYPEEALKKNVAGKVILGIVVDAKGKVSHAEVVSGPPELNQAALDSVKQWEFVPPDHAPVVTTAEVIYFHEIDCPGPVSEQGETSASGSLTSANGTVVIVRDDFEWLMPEYPRDERKAGISGDVVLSITVDADGNVTKVLIVKSLASRLDNLAVDSVRTWRFKLKVGSPGGLPDDFPLHIQFQPVCVPKS